MRMVYMYTLKIQDGKFTKSNSETHGGATIGGFTLETKITSKYKFIFQVLKDILKELKNL